MWHHPLLLVAALVVVSIGIGLGIGFIGRMFSKDAANERQTNGYGWRTSLYRRR